MGAFKCKAEEELALLREETQLKDEENALLLKRLHLSEEAMKR